MKTRAQLIESLSIIASPAADQLEYLKELGIPNGVDELALQFDDEAVLAEGLLNKGVITRDQCLAIQQVNEALEAISGEENARFWTAEALRYDSKWDRIRILASRALSRLR